MSTADMSDLIDLLIGSFAVGLLCGYLHVFIQKLIDQI